MTVQNEKKILITALLLSLLIASKFWIGIYEHDEFSTKHIFIKHRPLWQTHFYSPRGMSDLKMSDMPIEKQKEQFLFNEFVLEN